MTLAIIAFLLLVGLLLHGFSYTRNVESRFRPAGSFVEINGTRLHYLDLNVEAEGIPLLLIHGASSSLADMKIALGDLADRHRLILVDRPGCGFSQSSAQVGELSQQSALLNALLAELGIEKAIVIGQSLGTAVALSMAIHHKDRVAGLLLLAPVSHRWPGGVDWYNHAARVPLIGWFFCHAIIPLYGRLNAAVVTRQAFWPNDMPEGYIESAQVPLVFRPDTFRANAEVIANLYPQISTMEKEYTKLKVPLRMLAGTHDAVVLSTIHGMSLRKKVVHATLRYIPQTGHPLHHFCLSEIREELDELQRDLHQQSQ
ncbi:MAG: alpha/beta hydrolase [Aquisalinus sp.]|nr:alpha/beta hydrolase [Aquisalinus sp.]